MWKRTRVVFGLILLFSPVLLAMQAQEFQKGSYVAHPPNNPSATFELYFGEDGKVTVKMNGNVMVEGKYVIKENRLEVLDQAGPMACTTGQTGSYTWKLDGKRLTLKAADDKCEGRVAALGNNEWLRGGLPVAL